MRVLLEKVILAELKKQLRRDLLNRAQDYVIAKCSERFDRMLMAPPSVKGQLTPCVVAFVIGSTLDGQRTMTAAALNEYGDLKEYKVFHHLTWEERPSKLSNALTLQTHQCYDINRPTTQRSTSVGSF